MFGKMQDWMKMMQRMSVLMKDEDFKKLFAHPKFQELMKDPAFMEMAQKGEMSQMSGNPKLAELQKDPELSALLSKVIAKLNLEKFRQG